MIIQTHKQSLEIPDKSRRQWAYCGLDVCVTAEVHDTIYPKHTPEQRLQYEFEMACQGPSLTMQLRGIRIDEDARKKLGKELKRDSETIGEEVRSTGRANDFEFKWGKSYAPPSGQLAKLFTERLGAKAYYTDKGNLKLDKHILNKYSRKSGEVGELAGKITALRDNQGQRQIVEKGIDSDSRFRFTMAIGQTETGRSSSYKDPYGMGDNIQNKAQRMRYMFVPDFGYFMIQPDLAQAESRCIAYISGDEAYIEAHETGNVHVSTAQIFWPDFGWSDDPKENEENLKLTHAEWIPQVKPKKGEYPAWSYYDMSKRNQHALNFLLKKPGLAKYLGCNREQSDPYYDRYFDTYPNIKKYHYWVAEELERTGALTTPLGFTRNFFSRYWEEATKREAVDFPPQSMVGQIAWLGTWRIWDRYDPHEVQVLMNGHDSNLVQIPIGREDMIPKVIKCMEVEVEVKDYLENVKRTMIIPVDCNPPAKSWGDCK